MDDGPAPADPSRPTDPAARRAGHRRPSGFVLLLLVVGALMLFTVIVVVSLSAMGLIGGHGSRSEQDEILQEIEDETGIATSSRDLDHPPQRDLRLGSCAPGDGGGVAAGGTLTNFLDEPADYELTVVVRAGSGDDLGEELARTVVEVDDVEPEHTVPWTASTDAPAAGDVTCKVLRIERTP